MKTLALFFAFSICALAIPTHSAVNPIRLPTAKKPVGLEYVVLDSDGDFLRPGEEYYINSVSWGAAGRSAKLGWLDSTTKCPSDVIVTGKPSVFNTGDPVKITLADSAADVVLPRTSLSITFSVPTNRLCVNSLSWAVRSDSQSDKYFLTSGEFVSNLSNLFKIDYVYEFNAYKLTYCLFATDKCYDVGIYYDEDSSTERLVLSDKPFVFNFEKATKTA